MICDKCGQFIEFSDDRIIELIEDACKKKQFKERNHRIVVFGTCKDCAKKEQ
jgi:Fur family ferric uptake transcriptional regulator